MIDFFFLIFFTFVPNNNSLFYSDIALVKLPSPVKFSDYVQTIALSNVPTTISKDVITMGYGLVKTNVLPQNLQYTKLKTIDMLLCTESTHNLISKYSVVCANGTQASLCAGDKGGPLVSATTGKLVGTAIFTSRDCKEGLPQGFAGIFAYTEWIDGVIEGVISKN